MNEEVKFFLKNNNINVVNEKDLCKGRRNSKIYIEGLFYFHHIFLKEENSIRFKFPNEIWKIVQNFKVWNERVERLNFEDEKISRVKEYARKSIRTIYDIDFKELIKRAMDRKEVCVERIYFQKENENNTIVLSKSSNITFRMIEDDYYKYFKKLKIERKLSDELINYALKKEGLGEESFIYIESLISYPYNSIKYLQNAYLKDNGIDLEKLETFMNKDFLI
ncbi:hypothetical protein [Clostridium sp.]|uniref:hypothetical protein n=1 Tax=Clostridium sp. TaxID=1506 RepID=UPI002609164F|nr:hypothetical protein [Clostridium sp.]